MQKLLDGFLSSDIGKLSQLAVMAAFPELVIAEKIGMPILRAFIAQVWNHFIESSRQPSLFNQATRVVTVSPFLKLKIPILIFLYILVSQEPW